VRVRSGGRVREVQDQRWIFHDRSGARQAPWPKRVILHTLRCISNAIRSCAELALTIHKFVIWFPHLRKRGAVCKQLNGSMWRATPPLRR
jgi:hypothetical protein